MRHGSRKFNMSETFTTYLRASDLNSAAVTNYALVTNLLILSAVTLPVFLRPENTLAEKPVAFRFQCTVINSFRFLNLSMSPSFDDLRRSQSDANGFEI